MNDRNYPVNLQPVGTYGTPAGAPSLYLLQVNNADTGSAESVPLHLLINDMDSKNQQYLVPLLQSKLDEELKLCINGSDFCIDNNPTASTPSNLVTDVRTSVTQHPKSELKQENYEDNLSDYVHIVDRVVPPRAVAVLPTALQIRRDCISPRRLLPARVRFGPLQGICNKVLHKEASELISGAAVTRMPIFLLRRNVDHVTHLDVSDKDKSNWLGLLPLGDQSTANVWLNEADGALYGVTTKSIASRTPLALGYSKKYAEDHNLPPGQPILDLDEASPVTPRQWWCGECRRTMASAFLLERHNDVYHKDVKSGSRRRYRCSQCTRTFSRLFTLKRHVKKCCTKKVDKADNSMNSESEPIKPAHASYTTQNAEDNRVPSDESLQNYTNGLDFPTNLFDTDRIPNLDMSGSSRSEIEFNSYSVCCREDSALANDLGFCEPVTKNEPVNVNGYNCNDKKIKPKSDEKILASCPYCDQTVVKSKKRQHLRTCPARRFECDCGQVYYKKQSLAEHIYTEHSADLQPDDVDAKKPTGTQYKCKTCEHTFKRRGMLVNHLWRVHNAPPSAVPLERRVRHYPCVACPKIYRAAAKRDRHVRNHHPGTELIRAAPIEGERRACEPAACSACPRQYATRAKLLQHERAQHPHLALPKRTKIPLTSSKSQVIHSTVCQKPLGLYYVNVNP